MSVTYISNEKNDPCYGHRVAQWEVKAVHERLEVLKQRQKYYQSLYWETDSEKGLCTNKNPPLNKSEQQVMVELLFVIGYEIDRLEKCIVLESDFKED